VQQKNRERGKKHSGVDIQDENHFLGKRGDGVGKFVARGKGGGKDESHHYNQV